MSTGRLGAFSPPNEVVHQTKAIEIVGDSPELVALALLRQIAQLENKTSTTISKDWLLDTYGECLDAVHGRRKAG